MNHTPAPWEAKFQPFSPSHTVGKRAPNGSLDLIADLRESVAQADERQANARLIAAAPGLLEELLNARQVIDEAISQHIYSDDDEVEEDCQYFAALKRIDALIATLNDGGDK